MAEEEIPIRKTPTSALITYRTQKSAILMMLLGEDEASEILRNLSPKEVQHWVLQCILYKA